MHLSVANLAMARGAKTTTDPTTVKHTVKLVGVGTKLEVSLKGGDQLLGTIQSMGEQDFVVAPSGATPARHIGYAQVQRLRLSKLSYHGSGQPDAAEARRAVAGWGVGKAIRVTLADGRKLNGKIQTIDMEHFSLLANSQAAPVQLAFTDVQQVGTGGMSPGVQWAILGGAVAAVVIVLAVLVSQMNH
jgi:small nuclear ribonucleoprotein (snRNP)-like protein